MPQAGVVTTQIALPTTPTLVGQVFHQQVLPLKVDAALNPLALTSSNALTMTIGSF